MLEPWEEKAHRLIAKMAQTEYRKANPSGRKRHKPYTLPEMANELVACLGMHDRAKAETRAKVIFQSYEVLQLCKSEN